MVLGKEIFGGTGMNILNPALTARAFLFFAYPAQISGDKVWVAGQGPIGHFAAQAARCVGAHVTVTDVIEKRLEAAEARGRAIEEKITALAGLPARLKASNAVAGEAARALVSLKSELARLAAQLKASAPSEKLTALEAGLAALKTRIEELASGNQSASGKEALAALKTDLAAIKARLEANAREFASSLSGFDKRLTALGILFIRVIIWGCLLTLNLTGNLQLTRMAMI